MTAAVKKVIAEAPKSMAAVRFEPPMAESLLEMFADMHAESPVMRLFKYDEKRVEAMLRMTLQHPDELCGFACVDFTSSTIVGAIIGSIALTYFSGEPIANDVLFYIRPEHRNEFVTKHLVDAYTAWAKRKGIEKIFFTPVAGITPDKIAKTMKSLGWKPVGQQMMLGGE